jgi:outer membrane protein TolC
MVGPPVGAMSIPANPPPRPADVMTGPLLSDRGPAKVLPPGEPAPSDRPLPINLATALRLSNGRPLLIAAAQARVQIAAAQAEKANVLWLPNLDAGSAYIRHTGGIQNTNGNLLVDSTNSFIAGGGAVLRVGTADAYFEPLAARQVLVARRIDTQTARNEALEITAESYFNVQMARGTYSAMTDATTKADDVVRRVESLARGLVAPDEIERARTLKAELEQSTQIARQQWRVSSANLTRVLRLDPAAVIVPLEPDHLQVTLIEPSWMVDDLIVVGLMNRPELASSRAIVRANIIRLQRERLRPLMPSLLVTGNGTPDFYFQGGIYATGTNGSLNQWAGRGDVAAQAVWQLDNLGFGYQAKVREQRGETELANIELFNTQDHVAAEVAQAKADVDSATMRVVQAETGLKQGLESYRGNLIGLGQTQRFNDILTLVNRPQEVVASLQQLQQAYVNYYRTVADFNRAQFRLFYALGFPAEALACRRPPGPIEPVDTYRGPALPNVRGQ